VGVNCHKIVKIKKNLLKDQELNVLCAYLLIMRQKYPIIFLLALGPVPTAIIVFKSSNGGLTFQSTMKPIFGGMNMVAALFFLWKMRQTNMKNMVKSHI
jgi:hypothetical protein